jgi:hypothetical protein
VGARMLPMTDGFTPNHLDSGGSAYFMVVD